MCFLGCSLCLLLVEFVFTAAEYGCLLYLPLTVWLCRLSASFVV